MKHIKLKEYIRKEITSILSETKLSEASNPDLERKIINLVRRCAKEYGIPMWDAFMAIEAKMAEMRDYFGEGKYSLEEKILSENQMTKDEAFRILRDIHSNLPKWRGPEGKHYTELMGQALDVLQAGEISKMMDRERGLSEDFNDDNRGLAQIKSEGETDGAMSIKKELKRMRFKNVPDMEAYTDGFVKGASDLVDYLKSKLGQSIRGGGDEESLMGLVGLNETIDEKSWAKLDRLRDAVGDDDYIIQSLMRAMSTDDANLYLDAMIRDHIDIVGDAENYDNVSENDGEPTKAELKKKDSVASISNKLQKLVQDMKDKAKEYKSAEGEKKEKIKDELKKMTKEKKSLEKSI